MGAKNRRAKRKCEKKVSYATSDKANMVAHAATKRTGSRIWSYRCQYCNQFHVGHPSRRIVQGAVQARRDSR